MRSTTSHVTAIALIALAAPACAGDGADRDEAADAPAADTTAAATSDSAGSPADAGIAGWVVRVDRPGRASVDDVSFQAMAPGFHVTTGPAAILYHPDSTATGAYSLRSEMYLFDPGDRREGYGVFFGGSSLDGDGQSYVYFLLRRDGRFMVKRRQGEETRVIQDWKVDQAVASWDGRPEGATDVKNVLGVDVRPDSVTFSVNGKRVAAVASSRVGPTDGVFGARINHALNVHVASVSAAP